jgi:hypothetical protein
MKGLRRNDDAMKTTVGTKKIMSKPVENIAEENASPLEEKGGAPASGKKYSIRAFGEMLSYGWILKNMGFFLFLSVLAVFYIANGHMADNRIRRINETARQLKDLQYEYKTIKSEMMFKSRESELVKAAEPLGLKLDSVPPVRIKAISASTN